MLEVRGLTKRYSSKAVVDDVRFRIDRGERLSRAKQRIQVSEVLCG